MPNLMSPVEPTMKQDVKIVSPVQTALLQRPLSYGAMGTVFGRTGLEIVFASQIKHKSTVGGTVLISAKIVLRRERGAAIGAMANVK